MFKLLTATAIAVGAATLAAPQVERILQAHSQEKAASARVVSSGYRSLTLEADRSGHFQVEGIINGRRLHMMADTGATSVVLNHEDAARIGIRPRKKEFTIRMRTANGETTAAPVMLKDIRIGSIRVRNVRAIVAQKGAMNVNLLGMSFIGALKRFELKGDELTLVQ
ncbi:TIGR02281 family clan AA aspartic protease [Tepidamorphus sp. 3E244]|uniref:retropepsin-like aspartic protease family protein n=1 Tax=Tepidamorphus sp. 3E244 TaxID=3385498 RepID=UPI0038FCFA77